MVLEEDWVKDSEGAERQAMHSLLQTFWVVEEQEADHASRHHPRNQCFEDLESQHLVQREVVAVELLQPSLSFLRLQQLPPYSAPDNF
jgi:hypothetical protein